MDLIKISSIGIMPLILAFACGDSSAKKTPGPQATPRPHMGGPIGSPQPHSIQVESFATADKGLDYGSDLLLEWKSNRDGKCVIKNSSNQAVLQKADSLPATGQMTVSAEELASIIGQQSNLALELDCEAEGLKSSKRLTLPISRFGAFKANNASPKSKEKVYLSWTSENLQGPCKINGQVARINPFEMTVDESPKTIKNISITCPGFKKNYEASIKLFVVPDNRLAWYMASDFTLNSKLIDSELDRTHYVIGDEPIHLSWKAAEGIHCAARKGRLDHSPHFEVKTEGGISSIMIDHPRKIFVDIECSAPEGEFPHKSIVFSLTIARRSVWGAGGISLTSMLLANKSEDNLKTQPLMADDSFRLYAYLDNMDASRCQIGLEGEAGSELQHSPPQIVRISKTLYRRPQGRYMAWVECKLVDGTYRKSFPVETLSSENQSCPEKAIKIYDISQLSLPSACPNVSMVLMAMDSLAWEPFRATGKPIKLKLSAEQTLKVDHHYDVVHYDEQNTAAYPMSDFIFTPGYLAKGENFDPLHIEIEGGAEKKIARLQFELVKAAKVTVKNVETLTNDLILWADEKSEFNFVDLKSAGRLVAAGSRQVRINAPLLKRITGRSLGDVNLNKLRSRPSIGGLHVFQNISLLVHARLESVTGEFTVEGNVGEVSIVPPGTAAVGIIEQPLKEIVKSKVDADSSLVRQRLNGSLLIAGNEVLQKVHLPQLTKVEGGGVIGRFKNLGLISAFSEKEEQLSSSENVRLLDLRLAQPGPGAHKLKLLPTGTTLDLGELDPNIGFGNILHIVRDPQLVDFKIGQ